MNERITQQQLNELSTTVSYFIKNLSKQYEPRDVFMMFGVYYLGCLQRSGMTEEQINECIKEIINMPKDVKEI
jgi:hypothetical protein